MTESQLQKKIIDWLKMNGVYVIKTRPGPGCPVGAPDLIGLYQNRWIAIEVKSKPKASFRPGQQQTLQILRKSNTHVYVANPENWPSIKDEIAITFL